MRQNSLPSGSCITVRRWSDNSWNHASSERNQPVDLSPRSPERTSRMDSVHHRLRFWHSVEPQPRTGRGPLDEHRWVVVDVGDAECGKPGDLVFVVFGNLIVKLDDTHRYRSGEPPTR